jgi:HSP20 family molecular chaperone IbpA
MKNTLAMNPRSVTQPTVFWLTASGTFAECMQQISAAIAGRAYELFEARGCGHGHDLEDWFRAKSEMLTPIPAKVFDKDGRITVRAEVPGFTSKDMEVLADPRRLIIRAKKHKTPDQEDRQAVLQGQMSNEILHVLDLPREIDPEHMTATIKNDVLEVTLPTVNLGKKTTVGVKAA